MTELLLSGSSDLRIGYVLTHFPKLAQTFISDEIEAVERAGVPVRIFAMNPPDASERRLPGAEWKSARTTYLKPAMARGLGNLALRTLRHPVRLIAIWRATLASAGGSPVRIARRISHLVQAALLAHHARSAGIHRLHAHFGLAPTTIAWLATELLRAEGHEASFSFTIHGFHDFVDARESRLDMKAAAATSVICISHFTLSQLCLATDQGNWPKYGVVHCGIDIARFAYRDPPPIGSAVKLLAVGRLSPEKGFAVLLDTIAKLKDANVSARLQIIGEGPERTRLANRIAELGLSGDVDLVGERAPDEVHRALDQSDIFVMPSFSEGLPISLMEAMAVGLPVVSTWVAGIPELARNGETAMTVPPANASELASAIGLLVGDAGLRHRIARAAREAVVRQHDLTLSGARMAECLLRTAP